MKIGVYLPKSKQSDLSLAQRLCGEASVQGATPVLFRSIEEVGGVDRLIVLGGDGTMLRAAQPASREGIPVIGINCGTVGFLTEYERKDASRAVALALKKEPETVKRSMALVDLNGEKSHCLNEVVLERGGTSYRRKQLAHIAVSLNGGHEVEFVADGLILSTPTGSTAYSLSAGGSVMTPDCKTFLLTPIFAFSLKSRPIVFPDDGELRFRIVDGEPMNVCGDGKFLGETKGEIGFTVKKSPQAVIFYTENRGDFFRRMTEKLGS